MKWYVYVVEGKDRSLYTGITKNIEKRLKKHNQKKGAKALRAKIPVLLVHSEMYNSHLGAARREIEIKSWTREKKLRLITGH